MDNSEYRNQNDSLMGLTDANGLSLLDLMENRQQQTPADAVTGAAEVAQICFLAINPLPEQLPAAADRLAPERVPEQPPAGQPAAERAAAARAGWRAPEPGPPRLRAGVDFETPAPLAADLVGTRYLQAAQDRLPAHVRDHILRTVDQLRSPDTREQARERLRQYGPAAVPALISQLDSPQFHRREAAYDQLRRMGDAAVPGLLSARDGATSLEMRRRCELLINELAPGYNGDVHDAQGRLRRSSGKRENFSANYDAEGRLTDVSWGYHGGSEAFVRRADGTFSRSTDNVAVRDLSVGNDGALSFQVGDATVRWAPAGSVHVTGVPVTSQLRGGNMTVPVRIGDTVNNVSVLPAGYPEISRTKW